MALVAQSRREPSAGKDLIAFYAHPRNWRANRDSRRMDKPEGAVVLLKLPSMLTGSGESNATLPSCIFASASSTEVKIDGGLPLTTPRLGCVRFRLPVVVLVLALVMTTQARPFQRGVTIPSSTPKENVCPG